MTILSLLILFFSIPVYLKNQKYKSFILFTIISFTVATSIDALAFTLDNPQEELTLQFLFESMVYNFIIFANTTGFAFFIETLDGIAIRKESRKDLNIIKDSQKKLFRTHVDLEYMQFQLNMLKKELQSGSDNEDKISQNLLELSDILRYKLYNNEVDQVNIKIELDIIDKIIALNNYHLEYKNLEKIEWGYDVVDEETTINKCTLTNIFTLILDFCEKSYFENKILYLLVEKDHINLYLELESIKAEDCELLAKSIEQELYKNGINAQQDFECVEQKLTYNLNVKLWNQ